MTPNLHKKLSKHSCALTAAMGVAAARARRLQERRSLQPCLLARWRRVWRRNRHSTASPSMRPVSLRNRVIGRDRKHRCRLLLSLNVCYRVSRCPKPWIVSRALHHDLQVRRIPAFAYDRDRLIVPDLSSWNGSRISRSLHGNPVDRLRAQVFFF